MDTVFRYVIPGSVLLFRQLHNRVQRGLDARSKQPNMRCIPFIDAVLDMGGVDILRMRLYFDAKQNIPMPNDLMAGDYSQGSLGTLNQSAESPTLSNVNSELRLLCEQSTAEKIAPYPIIKPQAFTGTGFPNLAAVDPGVAPDGTAGQEATIDESLRIVFSVALFCL